MGTESTTLGLHVWDTMIPNAPTEVSTQTAEWTLKVNDGNKLSQTQFYDIDWGTQEEKYANETSATKRRDIWRRSEVKVTSKFSWGVCWMKDWETQYEADTQEFDCEMLFFDFAKTRSVGKQVALTPKLT